MILQALLESVKILSFVFILMIIIEFLELKYKDKIAAKITKRPFNQYLISSFLGVVPGCLDAFFIVSLYTHGLVGFGALVAVMISTAGDEAFVMLSTIPKVASIIFTLSFLLGIVGGILADKFIKRFPIRTCQPCAIEIHEEGGTGHFFKEHIYTHIIKKHMLKLFLWLFLTLLMLNFLLKNFDLSTILPSPKFFLILVAALIGIIPESGPHLLFTLLYAKGLLPFSVLLVNSLVQDGHGLLPLLSYSIKDAVYVKIFNVLFGLAIGLILFFIGL